MSPQSSQYPFIPVWTLLLLQLTIQHPQTSVMVYIFTEKWFDPASIVQPNAVGAERHRWISQVFLQIIFSKPNNLQGNHQNHQNQRKGTAVKSTVINNDSHPKLMSHLANSTIPGSRCRRFTQGVLGVTWSRDPGRANGRFARRGAAKWGEVRWNKHRNEGSDRCAKRSEYREVRQPKYEVCTVRQG